MRHITIYIYLVQATHRPWSVIVSLEPVAADGKLCLSSEDGAIVVVAADTTNSMFVIGRTR